MEQIGTRNLRADFVAVYHKAIRRDGAAELLYWLTHETDFFEAPASCKYHLDKPGGLAIHSMNVWRLSTPI